MATNFEDLRIWQQAEKLVIKIYELSNTFPKSEVYALTSQIRRAALSVPANIAEAQGRYHNAETIHFLYNARGSAEEVRSLLITSKDLKYLSVQFFNEVSEEYINLIKGINSFIKVLRAENSKGSS